MSGRKGRRCFVRGCITDNDGTATINLHASPMANAGVLQAWKDFCGVQPSIRFPISFSICHKHFAEDCVNPVTRRLLKHAIPTIRPLMNDYVSVPDTSPKTRVKRPRRIRETRKKLIEYPVLHKDVDPTLVRLSPTRNSFDEWHGFLDLHASLPTVKKPSDRWIALDLRGFKPHKVTFEYVDPDDPCHSLMSVAFLSSLNARVTTKKEDFFIDNTEVRSRKELEDLLETVERAHFLPCGCPVDHPANLKDIADLQDKLSRVELPSDLWVVNDLVANQAQILFLLVDDNGRPFKSVSYSVVLLPRVFVQGVRCMRQEPVAKCIHAVERVLKEVEGAQLCAEARDQLPAREDEHRSACCVLLPKEYDGEMWWGDSCPACHSATMNVTQKKSRRKFREDRWKAEKEREVEADKLLFGSIGAVEKLLNRMQNAEREAEPMDADEEVGAEAMGEHKEGNDELEFPVLGLPV
ncbi:hypothetical protein RvY_15395 [Ramazzottius varieornatus]|uniref:THAP-type domain-containing protein n=1 Tax=Ramazzottius varieornatus TaxID=947166 RepID=A0A1D1W2S7_RAMVA|nr:hypothetical protein RvY_15395 [Ramazzottius varieornatus]